MRPVSFLISTFAAWLSLVPAAHADLASATCTDQFPTDLKEKPPAGWDLAALKQKLWARPLKSSATHRELECGLAFATWKAKPGASLVLYEVGTAEGNPGGGYEMADYSFVVASVRAAGNSFELLASSSPIKLAEDSQFLKFDLAPYRLDDKSIAFGIRTAAHQPTNGGGIYNESLSLFQPAPTAKTITRVFDSLMLSMGEANSGEVGEEGQSEKVALGNDTPAILKVLPALTNGMHDLEKRVGKKAAIFRWNRRAYLTQQPDPVKNAFN